MAYPYSPSKISQNPAVVGKQATLVISAYGTTFTHVVRYTFGSQTGNVVDGVVGGSYVWTIPNSFYDEFAVDETSKTGEMTCTTYTADGANLGISTCAFTISIDSDAVPNIDVWAYDTNTSITALTGTNTKIIQGHSTVYCEMQATSMNGSEISDVKITDGVNTYHDYSATFENATRVAYRFYATDTRGLVGTETIIMPTIPYRQLTCKIENVSMSTSGKLSFNVNGIFWNANFGAAQNTLSVQYRHRHGDNAWGSWATVSVALTPLYNSQGDYQYSTYTGTVNLTGLTYDELQFIQARAVDKVNTVSTEYKTVNTTPVFDWGKEDFNFNVPVKFSAGITGLTTLDGLYGTCDTSASTAAKVVDCADFQELTTGVSIKVKFTYGNNASSPTLNVKGTGAKSIVQYGTTANLSVYWTAGEVVYFIYDGTNWIIINGAKATTATYGRTILTNTINSDTDKAVTPYGVSQAVSTLNSNINKIATQTATTTTKGMVQLANTITDNDTKAATPGAVKDAIEAALGGTSLYGTWTPTMTGATSYDTQKGWYMKSGNIVTIGFYIVAYTSNNTTNGLLYISGVPFTASYDAAGGGICTAYDVDVLNMCGYLAQSSFYKQPIADKTFAGWNLSAGSDRKILGMGSSTILGSNSDTAAQTALKYPSNSRVEASGTICYMAIS